MAVQENINVVARVRPFSEWITHNRRSCLHIDSNGSSITVKHTSKEPRFELNRIFDENTTQEAIFHHVGNGIIDGFLEGINGTIFAYGQTGSGKTYTMLGPDVGGPIELHNHGIIPRAIKKIFEYLNAQVEKSPNTFRYTMKCSFLELYNEKLYDLLQSNDATIKIHSSLEQITVVGAAEFEVTTYEECIGHLWQGWDQRKVAETSMNRESSRSHAVFMLTLVTESIGENVVNRKSSRLNLVDLAGSERQGQTNNAGVHLKEAGSINKSLSILARVIRTLAAKPNQFISYRDSLLTHLLRDSLGGNARTTVVVNIHPNSQFVGDTISTLNFAVNVKKVKNTAHVNEAISSDDIKSWTAEISRLEKEVSELKSEKSHLSKNNETLVSANQKLQDTVASLQAQVTSYLNRSARRNTGFAALLERDEDEEVPRKINFEEEDGNVDDSSFISTLSTAQRKQRRQTQFISKPVEQPSDVELRDKLAATEKALEEEERIRSESELEVNRLFQIIEERNERIRGLETAVNEKIKEVVDLQNNATLLKKRIEDQNEQIKQLEERLKEDGNSIMRLEEDKEAMEAKFAQLEYEHEKNVALLGKRIEDYLKQIKQLEELQREDGHSILRLEEDKEAMEAKFAQLEYEHEKNVALLDKRIEDYLKQIKTLQELQREDGHSILRLEEDKEAMKAELARLERQHSDDLEIMKSVNQNCEAMRLEKKELEKQRDDAQELLAENTGHRNHSQKIHLLENMKNEMNALKSENAHLKAVMKAKGLQIPEKENKPPSAKHRK